MPGPASQGAGFLFRCSSRLVNDFGARDNDRMHTDAQLIALGTALLHSSGGHCGTTREEADIYLAALDRAITHARAAVAPPRKFKVGDRVLIARKVTVSRTGRECYWHADTMDVLLGAQGLVVEIGDDADDLVGVGVGVGWYFSPEALDLVSAA